MADCKSIAGKASRRDSRYTDTKSISAEEQVGRNVSAPLECLSDVLEYQAKRIPDAPAILAPGCEPLSYLRLHQHVVEMGRTLRAFGIGRHDRVAVMLPNGPEMASAILAVASHATCAPINPIYQGAELHRYFLDLRPRALIILAGIDSGARDVALACGVRVIELSKGPQAAAGLFTLAGERVRASDNDPAAATDVALLMLTSGTTSRAKIVPQTHANVCTSACSSVAAFALSDTDRCINVLPLFHGHGLHANLIASLAAGASVVCTAGCDIDAFFAWMTAFQPTWFSAVPTIHQAILAKARRHRRGKSCAALRFMRSASAPLPPHVLNELESTFEVPVVEFYGMTESTSAPIASNPLPPGRRKPGSVGIPRSLDVAIMGKGGNRLTAGQTGEIIVRGASVMSGYDGDPNATAAAFTLGWFNTGDLGFFDDEGYLFLTGRSREVINRGGEKISPTEIDEALLQHAAVAEAVTFAVPHPTLGEDVGAAVVLHVQGAATPEELRQFIARHVADFKVPRQVLITEKIPKSPTGKLHRVGLAAELGLASRIFRPEMFVAPRTPLESSLAACWAEILKLERVGIHDDFFVLGGDSLLAAHVLAHVHDTTEVAIEPSRFFAAPTIAETAHHVETLKLIGNAGKRSRIVPVLRKAGMPASFAQQRLWRLQRAARDMPFFNVFVAFRLTSGCEPDIFQRSIDEIVQRHEILRTTFAEHDGHCIQIIAPQSRPHVIFDDLQNLPGVKQRIAWGRLLQEEALYSFDLTEGPLFRTRLVRLRKREHLLLLTLHGMIVDARSVGVFMQELCSLYEAFSTDAPSPLKPLAIQYADFAHWQMQWRSHPDLAEQFAYWRGQLAGLPPMAMPGGVRRLRAMDRLRTVRRELTLPASLIEAVKRFALQQAGTLYMAMVAALKTVLQRHFAQNDVCVATLIANRSRPSTEPLIGPLANPLILRTDLSGNPSLLEVMGRVRATILAAFAHQDFPFEELIETLDRDSKGFVPAQFMISLHNASLRPKMRFQNALTFDEVSPSTAGPLTAATIFDISLMLREGAQGISGTCIYKPHVFDSVTIDALLSDFNAVLQLMITQPERSISEISM